MVVTKLGAWFLRAKDVAGILVMVRRAREGVATTRLVAGKTFAMAKSGVAAVSDTGRAGFRGGKM